jgi:hypothetical protein
MYTGLGGLIGYVYSRNSETILVDEWRIISGLTWELLGYSGWLLDPQVVGISNFAWCYGLT